MRLEFSRYPNQLLSSDTDDQTTAVAIKLAMLPRRIISIRAADIVVTSILLRNALTIRVPCFYCFALRWSRCASRRRASPSQLPSRLKSRVLRVCVRSWGLCSTSWSNAHDPRRQPMPRCLGQTFALAVLFDVN